MMLKQLDVITIGRSSVDLYGTQIGSRLEDMGSFEKYIGGSPTNIAAGCARLKLKSALITRVGNEHMGRFIIEELKREGVDTSFVVVDPNKLTALVLLGIKNEVEFPLIFFRENCADMALCEDDIDEEFIGSSRSLVVTGTHLSNTRTESAVVKALRIAKKSFVRTVLDIDYRPNLWGLSGHGDGENRFIESSQVTKKIQEHLHFFDLIVGTEEEFNIAGGNKKTLHSLRNVRNFTNAALVCKRGSLGSTCFTTDAVEDFKGGETGKSFEIDVFNVLGAGDGFMAGLLKGWLEDAKWPETLTYANACGALAVSRHGCTPAYPSLTELQFFLENPIKNPTLRKNKELEQLHWSTNRKNIWSDLKVFAFDHRSQLENIKNANAVKISKFKKLCFQSVVEVSKHFSNCGILCDGKYGKDILSNAEGSNLWIGRPSEKPGKFPLEFEDEIGIDCGGLREWSKNQVVKVLCYAKPDEEKINNDLHDSKVVQLFEAARRNRLEFLLEIIPLNIENSKYDHSSIVASTIQKYYNLGIYPDWWKLAGSKSHDEWQNIISIIAKNDQNCRGILVLGMGATTDELVDSFKIAAKFSMIKGFAVGRTIFQKVVEKWMSECIDDSIAIAEITKNYSMLCKTWDRFKYRNENLHD